MAYKNGLSAAKMAARICNREDNIYKQNMIKEILDMYAEEIQKALMDGERVQISKVGTIFPEVKVRLSYGLSGCNKEGGNPPYTKLRITRNRAIKENMNRQLLQNIEDGIYGLAKTPLSKQQLTILKNSGFIPEDAELPEDDEIIEDAEMEEEIEEEEEEI